MRPYTRPTLIPRTCFNVARTRGMRPAPIGVCRSDSELQRSPHARDATSLQSVATSRLRRRIGGERSVRPCPFYLLQEAIGNPSLQNGGRLVGLILGVIAEHMRQHLGVEDAARRRDEGAEILLPVESIAKSDALGGEMLS